MKIFAVSDVHSFLTPLQLALDEAGFDPQNPNHMFVSCGDLLDRGKESYELLKFVMTLERKALIRGNHDDLLEALCIREYPYTYDKHNGTVQTVLDIGKYSIDNSFANSCLRAYQRTQAYRDQLVDYFETKNHIFVHGWIPTKIKETPGSTIKVKDTEYEYNPEWRTATSKEFSDARWVNGIKQFFDGIVEPGKNIVCGHWHCSYGHHVEKGTEEFGPNAIFDPFIKPGIIAIDACTAYTSKVNVVVIEDELV